MSAELLNDYYENYNEDGRLLSRRGQVEFLTTMRYIELYLRRGMKILDIGSGTGRYSFELADRKYQVDAVELVQHNVDVFQSKINGRHNVTVRQGNILDLSFIADNQYDITLVLGPMYHLFSKKDKLGAIAEALRVTKPGGIIYVAYNITDASIIDFGFRRGHILELIENKMLDTEKFVRVSEPWVIPWAIFEMVRKEDIDNIMQSFNTERLHYLATDGFAGHMKDTVNSMDEEVFELYLKYHFTVCEREDLVGITHHSLDVIRKNESS